MNLRQRKAVLFLAAAMTAAALTGCDTVGMIEMSDDSLSDSVQSVTDEASAEATEAASVYPDYPVVYPEIEQHETGDTYEAESCVLGNLTTAAERAGFSGTGYVTGFSADDTDSLAFEVNVPSNQHYDLSFCIASDTAVGCTVFVNDTEFSSFDTMPDDSGAFVVITIYGAFLLNGESEIRLQANDGNIDVDYLKISNNTTLSEISYEADGELSNENAADSAKELMAFLSDCYGEYILTGQYASDETNSEMDLIYKTTGKYPVIRFAAFSNADDSFDSCEEIVDSSVEWYSRGGIVGLMWHWESPGENPSVYAEDTDFDLSSAVTDEDIAALPQEDIKALLDEGKISEECYELILDIDSISQELARLRDLDIPVLWRPIHEGSGDWYWWGAKSCGIGAYTWLWNLMYNRMTEYFELDNLIWVWNGQNANTLVDKDTFDIAALDIYMEEGAEYGSRYEQFAAFQKIVGSDKMIALSECSSIPDIDAAFRDNAVWSFFGLWYGKYLVDENGDYSEAYTSTDELVRAYNSSGALTLDEYIEMKNGTYEESTTEAPTEAQETTASEE